ncbi:MAG: hypothetical protein GY725_12195 [bacterium]|nr:hypothetical protein [bacterium]
MLPLETIAELLSRSGHPIHATQMRSLAAREEMRIDGFWEDLGASSVWGASDSIASLQLPDSEQEQHFRRALFQVAEEMELRGVGSAESKAYFERMRAS